MLINDPNNKIRTITIDGLYDKKIEEFEHIKIPKSKNTSEDSIDVKPALFNKSFISLPPFRQNYITT